MAILCPIRFSYIFLAVFIIFSRGNDYVAADERKVHIVYLGGLREGESLTSSYHASLLQDIVDKNVVGKAALIRSYTRSFNAFAAYLTEEESRKLTSLEEVVSVFPSRTIQPQTTRSWDFMGFHQNVRRNPTIESDIIIGSIDTGIWPESKSFRDKGFGPVPKKWNGECKGGQNFTCNKKLIGARFYNSDGFGDNSARDVEGHGTHTASIAAGNTIREASFFGIASGTARGGVPSARLAAYKVCNVAGCPEADILAAFDDAIADGVDIITISLSPTNALDFSHDSIAIGSFHAMEKGILTVNSAGNNGFEPAATASVAPWLFSVAASSTDRRIITRVVLGNQSTLIGNGVNSFQLNGTKFPLVSEYKCFGSTTQSCYQDCLKNNSVGGKITVCSDIETIAPHEEGAIGALFGRGSAYDVSPIVSLPASHLSPEDLKLVEDYFKSTTKPQAEILRSQLIKNLDAPKVATFSSRGPSSITPDILKPDITAPGMEILAAWSPAASPTDDPLDKRVTDLSILSGTSMSCPHTSAAAAYVKTFHPDWSPSALKSALMTTAWPMNAKHNREAEYAYGAGHIDPLKAVNPGLVYETFKEDYISLLCSLDFDDASLRKMSGDNSSCPKAQKISPKDMNYPSMAFLLLNGTTKFSLKFPRIVTNVGIANSTYKAIVKSPRECNIKVEPDTLSFGALKERRSFVVTATGDLHGKQIISASLEWSDGTHIVRSPIVIA